MKRYAILVRENYPGATIHQLTQCNARPKIIAQALAALTEQTPLGHPIFKYNHVEIVDISTRQKAVAQMKHPDRNVICIPASRQTSLIANLQAIFSQIDAMRADNGEQAAQGPAAQARPALPQRQPEGEP